MQGLGPLFVLIVVVLVITNTIKLLREWERGVDPASGEISGGARPGDDLCHPRHRTHA